MAKSYLSMSLFLRSVSELWSLECCVPRGGTANSLFVLFSIATIVTTSFLSSRGLTLTSLIAVVLLIVLFFLGLVNLPLLLFLLGERERSVMVPLTIVANKGVPPELVDAESDADRASVVHLVVVANPAADESPCGLPSGVGADTPDLSGLAAYR